MSKVGLYELAVLKVEGHKIDTGRHNQQFIGSWQEVCEHAKSVQDQINSVHPEMKVTVKPELVESIGPKTLRHMSDLLAKVDEGEYLAQFLAAQCAAHVAQKALEINPDLAAITEKILAGARQVAAQIRQAAITGQEDGARIATA